MGALDIKLVSFNNALGKYLSEALSESVII